MTSIQPRLITDEFELLQDAMTAHERKTIEEVGVLLSKARKDKMELLGQKKVEAVTEVENLTTAYMKICGQVRARISTERHMRMKEIRRKQTQRMSRSCIKKPSSKAPLSLTAVAIVCTGCQGPMTGLCVPKCPYNTGVSFRELVGDA